MVGPGLLYDNSTWEPLSVHGLTLAVHVLEEMTIDTSSSK